MTKPANPSHIVPCSVLGYISSLNTMDTVQWRLQIVCDVGQWAVLGIWLTMLPWQVLTIVTILIHIQNMQQQKQYTELIVQPSPDWYVTFEPHKPIKAPILDFVFIFRLSNGQEQLEAELWRLWSWSFWWFPYASPASQPIFILK